jgi:Flp pilus assembly protein TadG
MNAIVRRFRQARHGNVGIIFAFSLLPMIGLVGLGIDLGRTLELKSGLDAAIDAAALGAVAQAQDSLRSGSTSAAARAVGESAGANVFNANILHFRNAIGTTPQPSIAVQISGTTITATSAYSNVAVSTVFGKIFGVSVFPLSNSASSTLTVPRYLNISVAIDVSQSMGLAATKAGMAQLSALTASTPDGPCAFGCHVASGGASQSNETIARNNNIQLRIDVIRSATISMIDNAQSIGTNLVSFALYLLQAGAPNPSQPLTTLTNATFNYAALKSSATQIGLGNNVPDVGYGDSDFFASMGALTNAVPASGNGVTAQTPAQYVFLMTDGVMDYFNSKCTWGHCTGPFNPAWCDALKAKGVTVGVIYTTYLPMPTDGRYQVLVAPFASQIQPKIAACATAGWYYEASDATDIQNAIHTLFKQATGAGVLTR